MAFTMKNPPEFTLDVRQWDWETDADGVEMAKEIEKLLNNDAYLKENLEELEGNVVVVGDKGVPGGVASLGSDGKVAQRVDYSKVDNVPAMTWGNVTGKPSSFPPSAHTHTKSEVGLNNVDNTADASKRVSYAASAGDADTLDGKHASAFSLASHSHSSVPSATNAANADTVDGFHASQTPGAKSACVVTNASGYIMAGYINTNVSEENPAIGQFIVINTGKDGYFRKASLAHVKAALGLGTFTLGASVPAGAKFTDTTYSNMRGATASAAGGAGLVPAPAAGAATRYLRSDGTWQVPPNTNTTYGAATQSAAGLMSAADKQKLDGISGGNYSYNLTAGSIASNSGVKTNAISSLSGSVLSFTCSSNATFYLGGDLHIRAHNTANYNRTWVQAVVFKKQNTTSWEKYLNVGGEANIAVNLPTSSGTLSVSSSDVRLKKNIMDSDVCALSVLDQIKIRQFDWIDTEDHQKIGFVVDELEEIDGHFKLKDTGGYFDNLFEEDGMPRINPKCVDSFYLQGYEVKAIQELHAIIKKQAEEIAALKELIGTILPT
jgi:hypothetical protein